MVLVGHGDGRARRAAGSRAVGLPHGAGAQGAGAQLLIFKSVGDARPASNLPLRGARAAPLQALRRHAFELQATGLTAGLPPPTGSDAPRAGRRQGTEVGVGAEAFARGLHRHGAFAAETASELHAWLAEIRAQIARADEDAGAAQARAATCAATLWRDRGAHRTAAERRAVSVLTVRQALADAAAADPAHAAAGPAGAADQRGRHGCDSNASPVAAAAPYQQQQQQRRRHRQQQQQQQQQRRRRQQQQQQQQRSGKSSTSPARPFNGALQSLRPADVNARESGGGERAASKPAPKPGSQPCAHGELQRRQAANAADTANAARERYERNTPRKQARDAQRAQLLALECAALVDEAEWTPPPSPRQPQGARERRRSAAPGAAPGAVSSMRGRGALSRLRATLRRRTLSFAEAQSVSTVLV